MAGALYIWIVLAFALGCGGVMLLLTVLLLIGHWLHKRETGARHGFLELPEELRGGGAEPGGMAEGDAPGKSDQSN